MTLPLPAAEAADLSARLQSEIARAIAAQQGWMPLAEFWERALFTPGLGYYCNGTTKFGAAGDFITAPELSDDLARCLARQLGCWLGASQPDVLEFGPGSGRLAHDLLLALDRLGQAPRHYYLLERSADLRARQQALVARLPVHLAERVRWLDELPAQFSGVMLANELLDALPIDCWVRRGDGWRELGVAQANDALVLAEGPARASLPLDEALLASLPEGYRLELRPQASAWVQSVLAVLQQGVLLLIDYGYGRPELFHPQRHQGTLTAFYRHHQLENPLLWPGLVDLTAHVDFTAVADAALAAGAELLGFTTQAAFLLDCGLADPAVAATPGSAAALQQMAHWHQLTHPAEMGDLFKVMALGRGVDEPGPGFRSPGREYQL